MLAVSARGHMAQGPLLVARYGLLDEEPLLSSVLDELLILGKIIITRKAPWLECSELE